jgi:hypothetical protein
LEAWGSDVILCTICAAPAISIAPGDAPITAPGGIVVTRGEPVRAWCVDHAPWMEGRQMDLVEYLRGVGR